MDGAQDLDGLLGIVQAMPFQGRLVGPVLALGIARPGIPGTGHHRLVVVDQAILDHHPVRQGTPWCLHEPDPLATFRPAAGLPFLVVEGIQLTGTDVGHQLVIPALHGVHHDLGFQGAGRRATQGGEQALDRDIQGA